MSTPKPIIRDLDAEECHALLAGHHVGRLALSHKDRVDIFPIHYVHDDGWLYGRTAAGSKLEMAVHNRWVAFEVDEIEGIYSWRSVVVKGGLYLLRKEGSEQEQALYDHGIKMLRKIAPETFTPRDPLPERALLFRIHVDEISGRAASIAQ